VPVVHDVSCLHFAVWQLLMFYSISPSTKRSTTKMVTTLSPQIPISLTDVCNRYIKSTNFIG
jgi:hypothetical protein